MIDNSEKKSRQFNLNYFPQSSIFANSLNEMFPEQQHEDKTVKKAREVLGENYTLEQTKELMASYEFIIQKWLEEYEKSIFNNKTLKELLQKN